MVRHNNEVPHQHFRKGWQHMVKTWFDQPARKKRRRAARKAKAVRIFPRPTAGLLRPAVHGQTVRYNSKIKEGRGFSLEELQEAGIPSKLAPTIGIAVDHRRRNKSVEGLQRNVDRLKAFRAKLVIFPRRAKKIKSGDASLEERSAVSQSGGAVLPLAKAKYLPELVPITEEMKATKAYAKLRLERMNKRLEGIRKKRALEAEKEEKK